MPLLQPVETHTTQEEGFVFGYEIGRFLANERANYCKLDFHIAKYTDDLYTKYNITLPDHIQKAVKKRRAEYLAGRLSCRYILEKLGLPSDVLSKYPERQPYWPPGVCGSISHNGHTAIAAVIPEDLGWVGIDIEALDSELLTESKNVFTNNDERELFKLSTKLNESSALAVAFSAKESLFKALYPQLQFYFGFEYANVLDLQDDDIKMKLAYSLSPHLQQDTTFTAQYMLNPDENWVLTFILVNKQ